MRRSASPSKAQAKGSSTPAKRPRPDESSAVLKTPFKPLSGLQNRNKSTSSIRPATATDAAVFGTQTSQRQENPASVSTTSAAATTAAAAARELRTMSITDMQEEIAELELILSDRLATHNAARTAKGLLEQQPEQIVSEYTKLLGQYNQVKDAAQLIFDKIAEIEQLPAQDIFARYGVGEGET